MKKLLIIILLLSIPQSRIIQKNGLSLRRSNIGTAVTYSPILYLSACHRITAKTGFHLEDSESTFVPDNYGNPVEISTKQSTYVPFSIEYSRTLFNNSMEGSFRPLLCGEMGVITGLGRIGDTFKHRYLFRRLYSIGAGAEFGYDNQRYQVSVRYFSSPSINGEILLDFTIFWN